LCGSFVSAGKGEHAPSKPNGNHYRSNPKADCDQLLFTGTAFYWHEYP
jgi:hypothetical protein